MLKHLMILTPGEKRISKREEENLLPAAMEAEMQIDTSCNRMATCEKCEIKPLITTEPTSPKHLNKIMPPCGKSISSGGPLIPGGKHLSKDNQNITN